MDSWGEVTKLTASDGATYDEFGVSVAISCDTIVVGAPWADSNRGSAYVFERNQGGMDNWGEVTKLTASDGEAGDGFGVSVAISCDTIVVGAYYDDSNRGSAYIFTKQSTTDTTPPQITNIHDAPDPQNSGGYVNISCTVTDNIAVNVAKVNITHPDTTSVNVTMNTGSYYYNTTYTQLGVYQYFIWANDTSGNSNTSAIYNFTITGYTLTINTVGHGNVTKNPDQVTYSYGTTVTLTAVPDTGWSFSQWSGDLTGSTNPDTITMTGNKTVTATFTQNQYTLTINTVGNGNVTKNPDQVTYSYGTTVTLTAVPDTGWSFSQWTGGLTGSTNPDTITMTSDKTVTATFNELIIDHILITYESGNEIPNQNISTGFNLTGYAQAIYETLDFISVNWSVTNTGSSASTSPLTGSSSTFYSGLADGTAMWTIDDGDGHSDSVEFTINSSLYSMMLYKGWNLVTVPFGNDWTAETLGENITGCNTVTIFNANTQTFLTHVVGVPHDDFPIVDGVGYFVYCTQDSILSMPDYSITSVNVHIYPEWNIVGWYHEYSTTAESLGENISGTSVATMFDAETQTFLTHVVGVPHDNFNVERGMGLFIYTDEASYWHGEG